MELMGEQQRDTGNAKREKGCLRLNLPPRPFQTTLVFPCQNAKREKGPLSLNEQTVRMPSSSTY